MKRIEQIDALRGFALFGIIVAHFFDGYVSGAVPLKYDDYNMILSSDSIVKSIINSFVIDKFYAIFSLLFGLSFYLILEGKKNVTKTKFAWRLILLFLIGLIHHIHYRGDILTVYSILGLLLLLVRRLSNKNLLILGLLLVFNIPCLIFESLQYLFANFSILKGNSSNDPDRIALINNYFDWIITGKYFLIAKDNLTTGFYDKFFYYLLTGKAFVTTGLFFIGLWVGRQQWHLNLENIPLIKLIRFSIFFGVALKVLSYLLRKSDNLFVQDHVATIVNGMSGIFISCIYICVILWLFKFNWAKYWLKFLAPLGKMSLTNYLLQTVFGLYIFYGYGLGLLLKLPATVAVFIAIIFFVFQILLSMLWLKRFRVGPVEWLWRSAIDFEWKDLRIKE